MNTYKSLLKFHPPGIAAAEDSNGWLHVNEDYSPLYSQRYLRTFGYYCGRAAVTSFDGQCFHIDESGCRVYAQHYAWCGNFQENLCSVRDKENRYFHICLDGKMAYPNKYLYVGDYKDGIACVRQLDGTCKHINKDGHFINAKSFYDLGVFHKLFATAKDHQGWFHIDMDGNALYEQRYLAVEPFYNGYALVTRYGGGQEIINEKGCVELCIKY